MNQQYYQIDSSRSENKMHDFHNWGVEALI